MALPALSTVSPSRSRTPAPTLRAASGPANGGIWGPSTDLVIGSSIGVRSARPEAPPTSPPLPQAGLIIPLNQLPSRPIPGGPAPTRRLRKGGDGYRLSRIEARSSMPAPGALQRRRGRLFRVSLCRFLGGPEAPRKGLDQLSQTSPQGLPHERFLDVSGRAQNAGNPLPKRVSQNAPDRIRTCDLRFRRPTLYPAELRARVGVGTRGAILRARSPGETSWRVL